MRRLTVLMLGAWLVSGASAQAQTSAMAPHPDAQRGYVAVDAAATFGSSSSQSYGGEVGVTIAPGWQLFVEAGHVNNVSTAAFVTAAQAIAGGLGQTQSGVGVSAKEPVAFGDAGVRYLVPVSGTSVLPYVMAGIGAARVTQDAKFTIGGADVTGSLAQYGVQLGTDLSGRFTKPLLVLGGGVTVPVWSRVVIDLHYRYGRIFAADQGINVSRAGIGIGVRF